MAHDLGIQLQWIADGCQPDTAMPVVAPTYRERTAWAVTAITIIGLLFLAFVHFREIPPERTSLQLSIPLPANSYLGFLEISPDGRRLLMTLARDGKSQIYLRSLDPKQAHF